MIIDASLDRANCCGYPCGMPQPFPPQPFPPQPAPPVPPVPPVPQQSAVDSLQVQLATAQTGIASGAAIPLSTVLRQTGNGLSFSAATHAFTVADAGVYAIDWSVLVQTAAGGADPVIALQSLDGQTVLGYSGTLTADAEAGALLTGRTVAALPAGSSWVLVNASADALDVPLAGTAPAAFAASLTVAELPAAQRRFPGMR